MQPQDGKCRRNCLYKGVLGGLESGAEEEAEIGLPRAMTELVHIVKEQEVIDRLTLRCQCLQAMPGDDVSGYGRTEAS